MQDHGNWWFFVDWLVDCKNVFNGSLLDLQEQSLNTENTEVTNLHLVLRRPKDTILCGLTIKI